MPLIYLKKVAATSFFTSENDNTMPKEYVIGLNSTTELSSSIFIFGESVEINVFAVLLINMPCDDQIVVFLESVIIVVVISG